MKRFMAFVAFSLCVSSLRGELVITGTFDGPLSGGLPKVVELYAHGDTDLDAYGVGSANNGGGTDGIETPLSGFASDGTFVYVVDGFGTDGTDGDFASYFAGQIPAGAQIFDGSFSNGGAAAINGDDAVELFRSDLDAFCSPIDMTEVVTDVFGDINMDGSGEPWDHLDGWAYRNASTGPTVRPSCSVPGRSVGSTRMMARR